MTRWRPLLLLAIVSLLSACSGADTGSTSPTPTSPSPSAPSAAPTVPTVPPTASEGVATSPSAAASPAEPDAAALPAGHVLVASDRGVDLLAPDGTSEALTSLPARAAYDDGAGGVVLQGLEPPGPNPPSAAVMWLPPDGGDAITVVPDGAADAVHLWDAGVVDGRPVALVTVRTDAGSVEDSTETLQAVALPSGETSDLAVTGGWESGADVVTYGGGRVGVLRSAETEETFALLALSGEGVPAAANPLQEPQTCIDGPGCLAAVVVSADGSRLAWLEATENGLRLVVQGVDAEEPDRVVDVPSSLVGDARVDDVRVAGDVAVVNRVAGTGNDAEVLEALRIDLSAGEVEPLPLAGRAAPTR